MEEFNEMMSKMTENAKASLMKADFYSRRMGNSYVGTEHILLGMLAQNSSVGARFLAEEGVNLDKAEATLKLTRNNMTVTFGMQMMSISEAAVLTLKMSWDLARDHGQDYVGTEHILYSILAQNNSRAQGILKDMQVDTKKVMMELEKFFEKQGGTDSVTAGQSKIRTKKAQRFLSKFGQDLTMMAKRGELDPVIGRADEIERMITILSRRTKSNPVLIGEPGVGKTAIVEGLAQKIVAGDVPFKLIGKQIIQVDLAGMVAGTKFRGEFEERIKGVIDEAVKDEDVILFIDELHLLTGAGSAEGSMDAANILKPALAKGQINLIGATTFEEYRKYIEKDKALSRRFQTVTVNEPSAEVTFQIMKGLRGKYEKFHEIEISDEVLRDAINMSERYISDRFMPDKVIDVIDEAAALAKVKRNNKFEQELNKVMLEVSRLSDKVDEAAAAENYEKAALLKTRLEQLRKQMEQLKKKAPKSRKAQQLSAEDLAKSISIKTGIPVKKVKAEEMKLMVELEQHLKKYMIGQNEAVEKVARVLRRGRSGISDGNRPMGSFIFMGPTGVGKTELARVVAREVFGSVNALIKIDMSEFGEKHNVARLTGAPAGYVGYDDGGKLTEMIRRHPYSVVLFDEIEKAHPDVFNILLQILEDGVLTDGQGQRVKFNNTVVILTSNLGAAEMQRESELGFNIKMSKKDLVQEHRENVDAAERALHKVMKPELINRLDHVVVFNGLTRENVGRIFDNLIQELRHRLSKKGLGLIVKSSAKNYLISKGYDIKNGARPLRRAIEDELESVIAEGILRDEYRKGMVLAASSRRGKIIVTVEKE